MKVILSNYRYFVSGGPERYLFSIKDILEKNGHGVFPFSVRSRHNVPSEWEKFFMTPISDNEETYFEEYKLNLKTMLKVLDRAFYSPEGFFKARRYAKLMRPDLVYSLHFLNKMSPSIIDGFKSCGLPVVVRLSDFGLICPQSNFFTHDDKCEECITGSLFCAVKNKCVQGSTIGSLLKYLAWNLHRLMGSISRIDAFISPSQFTIRKFVEAGFPVEKFHYIPTFIDTDGITPQNTDNGYILYYGRLVKEKGVDLLLEAYDNISGNKPRLLVIGDLGGSVYSDSLITRYSSSVEFLKFMPKEQLLPYIQGARFVVIPSVCYDNLPNTLLEAFACGKGVVVSDHGCFHEFVADKGTGILFTPGDAGDLRDKLEWALENPETMREMGKLAREMVERNHKPQLHYEQLLGVFNSLMN